MTAKIFESWASDHMNYATLVEKTVVWIPYGYFTAIITRPSESRLSTVIMMPYLTSAMVRLHNEPFLATVLGQLVAITKAQMEKGIKPWDSIGEGFIDWLEANSKEDSESPGGTGHKTLSLGGCLAKYLANAQANG